jgi:hypothetical protein
MLMMSEFVSLRVPQIAFGYVESSCSAGVGGLHAAARINESSSSRFARI